MDLLAAVYPKSGYEAKRYAQNYSADAAYQVSVSVFVWRVAL